MKTFHSIKFVFTKEEIAHILAVWEMLQDMDDYDYNELYEQIGSPPEFFDDLESLLHFMENHVDLQDN